MIRNNTYRHAHMHTHVQYAGILYDQKRSIYIIINFDMVEINLFQLFKRQNVENGFHFRLSKGYYDLDIPLYFSSNIIISDFV